MHVTCNVRIRCAGIFGGALDVDNDENAIEWTHPPTRVWGWREGLFLDRVCHRHLARSRAGNQCLLLSTGQQSAGIPAPAMCTRKGYWSIVWCTAQ